MHLHSGRKRDGVPPTNDYNATDSTSEINEEALTNRVTIGIAAKVVGKMVRSLYRYWNYLTRSAILYHYKS